MYKQSMSYSQIASASVIAKEIEELEREREWEKRKVQHDFIVLMEKLNKAEKRSWADMVEEDMVDMEVAEDMVDLVGLDLIIMAASVDGIQSCKTHIIMEIPIAPSK